MKSVLARSACLISVEKSAAAETFIFTFRGRFNVNDTFSSSYEDAAVRPLFLFKKQQDEPEGRHVAKIC